MLTLGDEVLTPDSAAATGPPTPGRPAAPQPSFDKQYVRDWLDASGWDRTAPGPELPEEVVERTREKYVEAYERLTGQRVRQLAARGLSRPRTATLLPCPRTRSSST